MININTSEMRAALRAKFPHPEWSLMFEVRNAAGFDANRSADAIAMNTWPSRGLELHGIEIKVSRQDWKREVENPAKAESIAAFCDRWWVAAPKGVVPADQVPLGWGLIEFDGARWRTPKEARLNEAKTPTRHFMAALLRRAAELDEAVIRKAVDDQTRKLRNEMDTIIERKVAAQTLKYEALLRRVGEFEAASGVSIANEWHLGDIGKAVAIVRETGADAVSGRAHRVLTELEHAIAGIRRCLEKAA